MATRYSLAGSANFPQVEPGASLWLRNPVPRALRLDEIRRELDHRVEEFDEADSPAERADLQRVRDLASQAQDEAAFRQKETLSAFLQSSRYILRPVPGRLHPSRPDTGLPSARKRL